MAKVLKGDFGKSGRPGGDTVGPDQPIPGYQFKMSLTFSDPMIWRRIQVPGDMSLADFSKAIQVCMDWHDMDTHQFLVGKIFYSPGFGISNQERLAEYDEANFTLHELQDPMHFIFTYLYDGGEGWELNISLEEVFPEGSKHSYPVLLDGERACPPASIGDIHQYQALLAALEDGGADRREIILDDHEGYTFHPDTCDKEMINDRLKNIPV